VPSASDGDVRVATQAFLVDPDTMTVGWMNEAAAAAVEDRGAAARGSSVGTVLPLAAALGLPEALREVAASGVTRHLRTDVIGMTRRSLALVVAIHRLPDGELLVLAEHTPGAGRGRPDRRPPGRRGGGSR